MDDVFSELTETSTTSPKLFVDCSTVNPGTSRKWQRLWAERGSAMLDAPVSGGVTGATCTRLVPLWIEWESGVFSVVDQAMEAPLNYVRSKVFPEDTQQLMNILRQQCCSCVANGGRM